MRFAVVVGEQGNRVMGVTNVSERTRNVERCRQSFGELCYLQPADTFYWLINLLMWTFIAQPSGTAMEKERYANIGVWFKCRRATKSTLLLPNLIAEWRNENRRIERHWEWAKCSVSACSMFFSSLFFYLCAAAAGWMTDIFRWANSCLPFQFFFFCSFANCWPCVWIETRGHDYIWFIVLERYLSKTFFCCWQNSSN